MWELGSQLPFVLGEHINAQLGEIYKMPIRKQHTQILTDRGCGQRKTLPKRCGRMLRFVNAAEKHRFKSWLNLLV